MALYTYQSALSGTYVFDVWLGEVHFVAVDSELTEQEYVRYREAVPPYIRYQMALRPGVKLETWLGDVTQAICDDIDSLILENRSQLNKHMKVHELIAKSEFDKKARKDVKLRSIYDKKNLNIGAGTDVGAETVVVKDTKTGTVIGRRTLYQK